MVSPDVFKIGKQMRYEYLVREFNWLEKHKYHVQDKSFGVI